MRRLVLSFGFRVVDDSLTCFVHGTGNRLELRRHLSCLQEFRMWNLLPAAGQRLQIVGRHVALACFLSQSRPPLLPDACTEICCLGAGYCTKLESQGMSTWSRVGFLSEVCPCCPLCGRRRTRSIPFIHAGPGLYLLAGSHRCSQGRFLWASRAQNSNALGRSPNLDVVVVLVTINSRPLYDRPS